MMQNCCELISNNFFSDKLPRDLPDIISDVQKKITKFINSNINFDLPSFLENFNFIIYECDFKNALNPFIIQKLCSIMDFIISPYDIYPLEYYIEFLNIDIRTYIRYGRYYPELKEELRTFMLKFSDETNRPKFIPDNLKDEIERLLTYSGGKYDEDNKYNTNFPMLFLDELDLTQYETLRENQDILKHRIHLIDTKSDVSAVLMTNQSIPHDLAQLFYEYYHKVYYRIHEKEIWKNDNNYILPNGIYPILKESTLRGFYRSTGKLINDEFVEEQKTFRKKYFNL